MKFLIGTTSHLTNLIDLIHNPPLRSCHISSRLIQPPPEFLLILTNQWALRRKQQVNPLQCPPTRFWEEEVHQRQTGKVEARKDNQCLPLQGREHRRDHRCRDAAPHSPAKHAVAISECADLLWPDFGGVDECNHMENVARNVRYWELKFGHQLAEECPEELAMLYLRFLQNLG
jgi:hypothetical protein